MRISDWSSDVCSSDLKHAQRDALLEARVREVGERGGAVGIAYLNTVGGQDGLVFDGASVLADADGHVHPAARAFESHWLVADFDADGGAFTPVAWPVGADEGRDALAWRAIVLGTRDYCRKNGFDKVWLGLSGGIDSSVVLAVAAAALGADNVTAVRMPSRYTAGLPKDLARAHCDALGGRAPRRAGRWGRAEAATGLWGWRSFAAAGRTSARTASSRSGWGCRGGWIRR